MQGKNGHANGQLPSIAVVRRRCPTCHEVEDITITETADGRESWWCHGCNQQKEYRVR